MKKQRPEKYRMRQNFVDRYDSALQRCSVEFLDSIGVTDAIFLSVYVGNSDSITVFCTDFMVEIQEVSAKAIMYRDIAQLEVLSDGVLATGDLKRSANAVRATTEAKQIFVFSFEGAEGLSRDAFEVVNLLHILRRRCISA